MYKKQKELLENIITLKHEEIEGMEFPMIYILPTNKNHDSGYKIMYIVGVKDDKNYLIGTYSDVVDIGWNSNVPEDIHIDCVANGIIRIWSNNYNLKLMVSCSNCIFEYERKKEDED